MKATGHFVILCWGILAAFWAVSALSVKPTKERQPLPKRLWFLSLIAVAVALLARPVGGVRLNRSILPHTVPIGILADLVVLAGLFIALWARAVLGRNWSGRVTLKEDHQLIQRGAYRVVRHPIYSGLLLMVLGTAILIGRVSGFFALLISFCGVWLKLRQEEALLTEHFPETYPQYKSRTKALIPFVL